MATLDRRKGSTKAQSVDSIKLAVLENAVDFRPVSVTSTVGGDGSALASDVVQLLTIPAGSFLRNIIASVETVEGATLAFAVRLNGTNVTGMTAVNGNSAGFTVGTVTAGMITTDQVIDLVLANNAAKAKVRVFAEIIPLAR
jgi:hypothetical protein